MTANVRIGDLTTKVELIVFDKDGTLIDFAQLWHGIATRATSALIQHAGLDPSIAASMYEAMGFDPAAGTCDPDGPLAAGPNHRIYGAVTETLRRSGLSGQQASQLVSQIFPAIVEADPVDTDIIATGDVYTLLRDLKSHGIRVAVATADVTSPTRKTLTLLNVSEFVDETLCSDDPHHSVKPDPNSLVELANRHAARLANVVMVGDTIADMRMARQAGVLGVAVLTGAGTRQQLSGWSSCVIESIDAITIA